MLFHNICLLITKTGSENFGIVGLQIDNIVNIGIKVFMNKEEAKITKDRFKPNHKQFWRLVHYEILTAIT